MYVCICMYVCMYVYIYIYTVYIYSNHIVSLFYFSYIFNYICIHTIIIAMLV